MDMYPTQEKLLPVEGAPCTLQMRDVMLANCVDYWTSYTIEPGDNLQYSMISNMTLKDAFGVADVLNNAIVQPLFEKALEAPRGDYLNHIVLELARFQSPDGSLKLTDYLINYLVDTYDEEPTAEDVADQLFSIIEDLDWLAKGEPVNSWDLSDVQDDLYKEWLIHFLKEKGVDEFDIGWAINVVLPRQEDRKNLAGSSIQEQYYSFAQSGGELSDFIENVLPLYFSDEDSYEDTIKDALGVSDEFQTLTPEKHLAYVKRYIQSNEDYYLLLEDNFLYYQKSILPDDVSQILDWLS